MSCTRLTLAVLGAALAAPATTTAQGYPTAPPVAGPVRPMPFPPFQEARLSNGIRLILVESAKQPVVSLSLSFAAGHAYDPEGREGLAGMVASLLTKGAGNRTAEQVSATIEGVGGTLSASTGPDFLTIGAYVLAPQAELGFSLMADAVIRPTFAQTEVELYRTQALSGLQLEQSDPAALGDRFMARTLYGSHPYARRPTPAAARAITRDEIVAYQQRMLRPGGALLVVAGALTLPEARRMAEASFAGWTGTAPVAAAFPAPPARSSRDILLVHRAGSVQANILVGNITFPPTSPQQYAARVANQVLGGGSDSRLFAILREEKGWTYGAYSGLNRSRGVGSFVATAEVRNEVADSSLREILHQMERLTTEPIPTPALEAALGALVGRFPLTVETVQQVAGQVSNSILLGLPADYLSTYRTRLAAVTAAQALEGAKAAIRPATAAIIVVGDAKVLLGGLAEIGPVRLVGTDGTEVPADQLMSASVDGPVLDLSKVVASRDSFAVMVQGNAMGSQVSEFSAAAGGFLYSDDTRIPLAGVEQSTEVVMAANGSAMSVTQRGKVQGNETSVVLTVTNGRATGKAVGPQPPAGAFGTVEIDSPVPSGTLDDNTVTAIVGALPWSANASWSLSMLSSGSGEVRQIQLAVTGTETITVPAGSFEVYRAEMSGGPSPVTLYVTVAAPHYVVKIAPVGAPIEIVLVKRTTP
ncbi:MAG: pitrilysin family protein [Gemmatimonadota bacterium]|nr:pitrilysin family protein [Gemmatimonadota bacterium]